MINEFTYLQIKSCQKAKEKVLNYLLPLSPIQINWKPAKTQWSIAECLEHLLISDSLYFDDFEALIQGKYRMTLWERFSPLSGLLGWSLKRQLTEEVKRKMTAPKTIQPSFSDKPADFVQQYLANLEKFMFYIDRVKTKKLKKVIINSPTIPWVTYSLKDAIQFLVQHEHRHINQALRVIEHPNFPSL